MVALVVGLLVAVFAFSPPALAGLLDAEIVSPPPPAELSVGDVVEHTFEAEPAGATWSIVEGSLPMGVELDPGTGVLSGPAMEPGSFSPTTVRAAWTDPFVAVAAGQRHTCAILGSDGSARCWGDNGRGQANDQPGPYVDISAGAEHTCAIRATDGSVHCWGNNSAGQATDQFGAYTAVSAGSWYTCAIAAGGGNVHCWGDNVSGQLQAPNGSFSAIATGPLHACAISADDASLRCWGTSSFGLADDRPGPYIAVAAGTIHTCGLLAGDGTIECWGFDNGGVISGTPEGSFTGLASGGAVACADPGGGELVCWGSNEDGLLNGPQEPLTLVDIDARHACGIEVASGAVRCWGWNGHGRAQGQVVEVVRTQTFSMTVTGEAQSSAITGTVTDPGGQPVDDVLVSAFARSGGFQPAAMATTNPDGSYELGAVAPGWYGVVFHSQGSPGFATTWYGGSIHRNQGDEVAVPGDGAPVEQIDVTLLAATSFAGTVTDQEGTPVPGVTVAAFGPDTPWLPVATTSTDADGTYALAGIAADDYHVSFALPSKEVSFDPPSESGLQRQWYPGASTRAGAVPVPVAAGDATVGIDAALVPGGAIEGYVVTPGVWLEEATVMAWRVGVPWVPVAVTTIDSRGLYLLDGLPPGTYHLRAQAEGLTTYWYPNAILRSHTTPVVVEAGMVELALFTLHPLD